MNSLGKRCKQGKVYGAGDAGTVSEIEGGEAREDLLDGAVGRQQLRLDGHGDFDKSAGIGDRHAVEWRRRKAGVEDDGIP